MTRPPHDPYAGLEALSAAARASIRRRVERMERNTRRAWDAIENEWGGPLGSLATGGEPLERRLIDVGNDPERRWYELERNGTLAKEVFDDQ